MSSDIRTIAQTYILAGWSVIPLVPGAKKADTKWQTRKYQPDDFQDDSNIAVKLGDSSDGLVDVDCDSPLAVAAAKLLLPNTGRIFGRSSKPESHYLFKCPGLKTSQFTGTDAKMIIEARSTHSYTMFPPSVHPTGEHVAWNVERDVMVITPEALYDVVREVALVVLIAEHWSSLNHAGMGHLAGFWLQAKVEGGTVLRLFKTIAALVGGSYEREITQIAQSTIGKHERGEPITGAPKLAEQVGDAVVSKMRSWLRMADTDAIEEMNEKHFWVRIGKDDVIGREDDDHTVFQRPKSLYTEYANRQVLMGVNEKGKPEFKPIFQAWLEAKNRRSYRKVIFAPPPVAADPRDYNLWKGMTVEPKPGSCARYLEHLHEVICNGNDEHYRYLTKLLAFTIQQPGSPSQVACVMRGPIGAGKGTLVRMLEVLFGRHYIQLDKVDQLVGRFNSSISGKVVVFADEAFWAGDKREVGALKRLITEPTLAIEQKNIDIMPERNCVHLFMATNEDWAIPAGMRERRFFAVEASGKHIKGRAYFDAIYKEMYDDGGAAAFLHEMLQVPVTANEVRNVPMTGELRIQQAQSLSLEMRWWHECLYEGRIGPMLAWDSWVPTAAIYDTYKTWAREVTNRFLDKIEFGRRMQDFISAEKSKPRRINGDVERCWNVRSLVDARRAFDEAAETGSDWPDQPTPVQTKAPF